MIPCGRRAGFPRGARVLVDWAADRAPARRRRPAPTRAGLNNWQEPVATHQAAGTLLNTYTTAKSVINPQALYSLPPNWWKIGRMLHVFAAGGLSNIVTTPGTINFQVKLGTVAAFDTGAIQLNATAHTTLPFWFEAYLTCRAVGSGTAASLMGQAVVIGRMVTLTAGQTDDAQGMQTILAPAGAPAVGTGFDSTVANVVDFWVGFSISNAGNGIQIQQYKVTDIPPA
jgi:hypothetical protein